MMIMTVARSQGDNPFKYDRADPMGASYASVFYALLAVTLVLAWLSQPKSEKALSPEARRLKWLYLTVWYICVAGDWLQGPYVYALYNAYGFSRQQISQLFVAGFGASMLFGTFVGSLADKIGRKRGAQLYCVLYIASCATKHFADYRVLMAGRLTGGIATSLLFSVFESWLVAEACEKRMLDKDSLGHIFAHMWFGSSLVVILAGIVGDAAVDLGSLHKVGEGALHFGGFCSPFDLAIVLLAIGLLLMSFLWEENYGTAEDDRQAGLATQVSEAVWTIAGSKQLLTLMMVVACFEGSMYAFVFNWTPALNKSLSKPAFGMVFASFMMAYMCGSSAFDLLRCRGTSEVSLMRVALGLGATSFLIAGINCKLSLDVFHLLCIYFGFLAFEFCCGLYFPAVCTIKGEAVPENIRSTVYNTYRMPMNAIVLTVLLANISMTSVFAVCFAMLVAALLSTTGFEKWGAKPAFRMEDAENYGAASGKGQ